MAQADFTRIAANIGALNALSSLRATNTKLGLHQTRLATGKRINSAEDDPAGLTIATKMLARSEGLKVAMDNIGDAKNMMAVGESGLQKISDILIQMRSKAEQAANDSVGDEERVAIQNQLSSFAEQVQNIVDETKWNGSRLLDGTVSKLFQTGAETGETTTWQLGVAHDPTVLGISSVAAADTASKTGATNAAWGTISGTGVNPFTGLSRLDTGSYKLAMKAVATANNIGKATEVSRSGLTSTATTTLGHATTAGTELGNGAHVLNIVSYTAGTQALVYNWDGGTNQTSTLVTGSAVALLNSDGTASGTTFTTSDQTAAVAAGSINMHYVQHNTGQMQLQSASGQALAVDADGSTGGATGSYFYVNASATYDTGRGLTVAAGALAAMQAGEDTAIQTFDYQKASAYSVDVSTATKAGTYMATVSTAIGTVSKSMSDLGSLMARLTYKEETTSVAQVNTEAAYNRIMNADMAYEQVEVTRLNILSQTSMAMLSQANQAPQNILSLFR